LLEDLLRAKALRLLVNQYFSKLFVVVLWLLGLLMLLVYPSVFQQEMAGLVQKLISNVFYLGTLA